MVCFLAFPFVLFVFGMIFRFVGLFFCSFSFFHDCEKYWKCCLKYVLSSEKQHDLSTSFPFSSPSNVILENICNILIDFAFVKSYALSFSSFINLVCVSSIILTYTFC